MAAFYYHTGQYAGYLPETWTSEAATNAGHFGGQPVLTLAEYRQLVPGAHHVPAYDPGEAGVGEPTLAHMSQPVPAGAELPEAEEPEPEPEEELYEPVIEELLPEAVAGVQEIAEITQPGMEQYWESIYGTWEPVLDPETGEPTGEYTEIEPGLLSTQMDLQQELMPYYMEALGFTWNEETQEWDKIPPSPYEVALEERRLAGMGYKEVDGELVELTAEELDEMTSPGLQMEIERQRTNMTESLSRKGITPGSTAYIQAMATYDERATSLRQQEREGYLYGGQQLVGAETARTSGLQGFQEAQLGRQATGLLAPGAPQPYSPYGGLLDVAAAGMQPYQYQQGLEYGILPYSMQLAAGAQGPGTWQTLGTIGGMAAGGYFTGGSPWGVAAGGYFGSQIGQTFD